MGIHEYLVAAGGLVLAPFIHGVVLAALTPLVYALSRGDRPLQVYQTNRLLRYGSDFVAGVLCSYITQIAMSKLGYRAGWIWFLLLVLYFAQNYFYRASKGMLVADGFYLLAFAIAGIGLIVALKGT